MSQSTLPKPTTLRGLMKMREEAQRAEFEEREQQQREAEPVLPPPRPLGTAHEEKVRLEKINAIYRRRAAAVEEFRLMVGTQRKEMQVPMIQAKGAALREWGELIQLGARERDPEKRAEIYERAEAKKGEAEAMDRQADNAGDMSIDLLELKTTIEAADEELRALGVHVPKAVPTQKRPRHAHEEPKP